jgi:hypothetical protein
VINFVATTQEDLPVLKSWVDADSWHQSKEETDWWLRGYLSFKLTDDRGITVFVRFDREGELVRLHSQFATSSEVSEVRVALSISEAIPRFIVCARADGVKGIITESISPKLIAFLTTRLGFVHSQGNDYVLMF